MGALETLLRQLGRRGVDGGLDVQERDGGLYFRDRFALLVAERRS